MDIIKFGTLDFEMFGENGRYYFLDLKLAKNKTHYLAITRSDKVENDRYTRSRLVLFEEDIPMFVEALSMVLTRFSHGEGRPA